MSAITSFSWNVAADLLELGETCSQDFTAFGFSFTISAFLVQKQNSNFLCFKVTSHNMEFHILELIVIINIISTRGPSMELPVPLKFVISKENPYSDVETDLDFQRLALGEYIDTGNLNFNVAISSVERSDFLLTHDVTEQNIDDIIKRILSPHKLSDDSILTEEQSGYIFTASKSIFLSQPNILRLRGPIVLIGDLHGKYFDLLRTFRKYGFPDRVNYLLLGDYIDRGPDGLDIMYLLCALKVKYPDNIFLLRGNHECQEITTACGFKNECERKNANYKAIVDVFNTLPFAAIISNKIFVVHGGISPRLTSLDIIEDAKRPLVLDNDDPINDLLWSDPTTKTLHYGPSDRGPFSAYGKRAVAIFLKKYGFELIVRAHEIAENGFRFPLTPSVPVITLFSATDAYDNNKGAAMIISADLHYTFDVYSGYDSAQESDLEQTDFSKEISL